MSEVRPLSVSQAMQLARRALEGVAAVVVGEVTEVADKPGYKAVYFTLGDGESVMPCLMWRDAYASSAVRIECGALVEVSGAFTAYLPKGRMQFQVRTLAAAGEGVLRVQVAALARRLESEGLMRAERKRPCPTFPSRIGLVTSPRGKAVHDVIRTLRRRYPLAELFVAGVSVEGAEAARTIAEGLAAADAVGPDVIILARGGGSYEDLMPFNAEIVARAIVSCAAPVVTGIGHEPDTTIADMVADVRASTPTAAAEAVSPSCDDLSERLGHLTQRLGRGLAQRASDAGHRVRRLAERPVMREAAALFGRYAQAVDIASDALGRAIPAKLASDATLIRELAVALTRAVDRWLERAGDRVSRNAARLGDLSPLAILKRGYAVCFEADGRTIVRSVRAVASGGRVCVRVADGTLGCVVENAEMEG